jgi:hypothetical protein
VQSVRWVEGPRNLMGRWDRAAAPASREHHAEIVGLRDLNLGLARTQNRISSSDRGRPDRFNLDQCPWPVLRGPSCTAVNCN